MTDDPRFTVGSWKGKPNYQCRRCRYATLDRNLAIAHWVLKHEPPKSAKRPSPILLADASGREIVPVVTEDDEDEDFETEVSEDVDLEA